MIGQSDMSLWFWFYDTHLKTTLIMTMVLNTYILQLKIEKILAGLTILHMGHITEMRKLSGLECTRTPCIQRLAIRFMLRSEIPP